MKKIINKIINIQSKITISTICRLYSLKNNIIIYKLFKLENIIYY